MLSILLTSAVLAAPADFKPVMTRGDCTYYMGEQESDGVTPVRVECLWKDADREKLDALLSQSSAYHEFVWAIDDTRQVEVMGKRSLVWQRHVVPGTAPREAMVWMETTSTPEGGNRYSWQTAGEDFIPAEGNIRAVRNDGFWEVNECDGGVEVVLQASYDPGGRVPDWLVRWTQTIGADRVMSTVHALSQQSESLQRDRA